MEELIRNSTRLNNLLSISSSIGKSVQIGGNIPSYVKMSQPLIKKSIVPNKVFALPKIESSKQDMISNKIFEDMSKIESLRQIDFLPEIATRDDVEKSLHELEKKYGMDSKEFYFKYTQGKAEDSLDSLKWAILYELWMKKYLIQV
ncbi:Uncharacterised protein [uncultured archaeon]|nr:Uncharacterised protein [uncultured archaeon]